MKEKDLTQNTDKILNVKNLEISFNTDRGDVQAVRDVSFELAGGETLAIVGESGSGKSVTAKAVLGILPSNAHIKGGEIIYDNKNLLEISEEEYNKIRGNKITMIFQNPMSSLDPIMKVGQQITEAILLNAKTNKKLAKDIDSDQYNISKKEAKKRAIAIMDSVGIADAEKRFNQYPFEFSGGMIQRIVIAIAIAANPEILVCDEPTTALDVTIQAQILELINKLKKERGLAVVFITHDLGVVAGTADRVAVMYAGKIVEYGMVDEIFYDPRHPYTWALFSSMPDMDMKGALESIPGTHPDMISPPKGDAFAPRNKFAMEIDFEQQPPFFKVSDTHYAATWLLSPNAPEVSPPKTVLDRIAKMKSTTSDNRQ